jgi:hypothetical protein
LLVRNLAWRQEKSDVVVIKILMANMPCNLLGPIHWPEVVNIDDDVRIVDCRVFAAFFPDGSNY